MKYKKNLTVTDFLYMVRAECSKSCSNCKFKQPNIDVEILKKCCVFRDFRNASDKSISYISSLAQTFNKY